MSDAKLSDFDVKVYSDTCDLMPPRAPVGIPAESLAMLLTEIRHHRGRRLSAEDRRDLAQIRDCIDTSRHDAGILFALLDRLLAEDA